MISRKLIRVIHLWLGLITGIVVIVVSFTGCIYVFVDEIESLTKKDLFYVAAEPGEKLGISELRKIAEDHIGKKVRAVALYSEPERTAVGYASGGDPEYNYRIYLNPYTGHVLGVVDMEKDFFNIVVELHYSLLLGDVGSKIIGYAVLLFLILLVTGIVLWWPGRKGRTKSSFTVKWSGKWRRKNYDLHNVLGFYASWIAVIIALTGLTWSFDWVKSSIYWLASGESKVDKEIRSEYNASSTPFPVEKALSYTMNNYPYGIVYWVAFPKDSISPIYIYTYYKPDDFRSRDSFRVRYDQYTGRTLEEKVPGKRNRGEQLEAMNYDIHVGAIFGLPSKILAFLTSFTVGTLPITGFIMWLGRRKKKKKHIASARVRPKKERQIIEV